MVQKISVVSVRLGKGNTSKGITFFPENFLRDEPFHLNSPRNFRVFHVNVSAPWLYCSFGLTSHWLLGITCFTSLVRFSGFTPSMSQILLPERHCTLKSSLGMNDTWPVSQVGPWYPWRLHTRETFADVSSIKLTDDPE